MEEVSGIPSGVPTLPLYPPESIRNRIPLEEWQSCIDAWLFSIEYRLRLKPEHFIRLKLGLNTTSDVPFLASYLDGYKHRVEPIKSGSSEAKLHHQCYFLLKRLLLTKEAPIVCPPVALFGLLSGGSIAFRVVTDWKTTLKQLWNTNTNQVIAAIDACKSSIIKSGDNTDLQSSNLDQLKSLVRCLPEAAMTVVAGVDFLEAVMEIYQTEVQDVQREATETIYYCLRCLMSDGQKRTSLLLDTLFEMKSEADKTSSKDGIKPNLLSALLCTTPFLRHLRSDAEITSGKRGQSLVETMSNYKQQTVQLHPLSSNVRRKQKGKQKVSPAEALHMHKASKISQVHDLFPDLSNAYVLKLLDHFADDVEVVIAALLEPDSLPPSLQDQNVPSDAELPAIDNPPDLAPRSTPPSLPQRKNVFDNDEFDKLQISSSRLHKGRKEIADVPQSADELTRNKAAIMAALAKFDSDDDERDDTYDVADVGASVDNSLDSDETRGQASEKHEESLFKAWKDNPELFARDSKTRISKARQQLKEETGMADEQIEGWAIMLSRDRKMIDRLQAKYSVERTFRGQQRALERTSWGATASPSDSQDEGNVSSDGRRVGQAGIRGTRQWNRGRGRGASTSGPADSKETQLARKRKEQGRGRGGSSHNRREGRAKKMGRGMGPISS